MELTLNEKIERDMKDQDLIRVWNSVRHEQAPGLARRILSNALTASRAAIPPPRLPS